MNRYFSPASTRQAFDWIDQWPRLSETVDIALAQAGGYLLAQPLIAKADIPAQALCVRNGYAVIAADTLGAGDYNPLPLRLADMGQALLPGHAVRVCTGDPLPAAADAVLSLQQVESRQHFIDVSASVAAGEGVIQQGEECAQSQSLMEAGRRLRPQDLSRLALAGITQVRVRCKPRVHLILAGSFPHEADGIMLTDLIARDGAELIAQYSVSNPQSLSQHLGESGADLILIVGSGGYGDNDFAVKSLHDCGQIDLDGVTIHPGGGTVMGQIKGKPILILPGSPLSCLCAYDLIAARLLRRMAEKRDPLPYTRKTFTLSRKLVSRIGQLELARMRIQQSFAEPLAVADDRLLSSSVRADGFVLLPENSEGYAEGSEVEVYLYDE